LKTGTNKFAYLFDLFLLPFIAVLCA